MRPLLRAEAALGEAALAIAEAEAEELPARATYGPALADVRDEASRLQGRLAAIRRMLNAAAASPEVPRRGALKRR